MNNNTFRHIVDLYYIDRVSCDVSVVVVVVAARVIFILVSGVWTSCTVTVSSKSPWSIADGVLLLLLGPSVV